MQTYTLIMTIVLSIIAVLIIIISIVSYVIHKKVPYKDIPQNRSATQQTRGNVNSEMHSVRTKSNNKSNTYYILLLVVLFAVTEIITYFVSSIYLYTFGLAVCSFVSMHIGIKKERDLHYEYKKTYINTKNYNKKSLIYFFLLLLGDAAITGIAYAIFHSVVYAIGIIIAIIIAFCLGTKLEHDQICKCKKNFIGKCIDIIYNYTFNELFSEECQKTLIENIKKMKGLDEVEQFSAEKQYERVHVTLSLVSFNLLSSGTYHFYAGSLNGVGKELLKVYYGCAGWLLEKNLITKEDYDDKTSTLIENIRTVG